MDGLIDGITRVLHPSAQDDPLAHERAATWRRPKRVYLIAPVDWKSATAAHPRSTDWSRLRSSPATWATPRRLAQVRVPTTSRRQGTSGRWGALLLSLCVLAGVVSMLAAGRPSRVPSVARKLPADPIRPVLPIALAAVTVTPPSTARTAVAMPGQLPPAEAPASLLSDVSTMDLMMPIAEPDLDITSRHSLWVQIGKTSGIDPLLLYSVALVESKALYPNGKIAPTPWLFRVNNHLVRGDRHHVQLEMAAATQFGSAVQDVGIMQVYYPMHRDAVRDPLTLLNPRTNITVAAKILRKGMHQTRDRVLGVGYYHSHTPVLARDYGTAVLTVYRRLKGIYRTSAGGQVVAR